MKSRKRVAQFMLAIIAFSIVVSALPGLAAFAEQDPYKLGYDTKDVAGSLPKKIGGFLADQDSEEYDKFTDEYDLQDDETAALKEYWKKDLCDRTGKNSGVGHPTFLGMLFKLVGDSESTNIKDATVSYEESQIKPEMVPFTDYDCFPKGWEDAYSEAAWHNFQRSVGTYKCGTFDVTCEIEKALRRWISDAIKTGLTWIMNIATGSGSGGDFQECRVGSGQDVDIDDRGGADVGEKGGYSADPDGYVDENIDAGFTHEQMAKCDAVLNNYYALDKPDTSEKTDGQLVAIGLKGEPKVQDPNSPNYGKFDLPPEQNSGDSSLNSQATRNFFAKSANIGIILAVGMLVGAVIQAMVQQKPQLLFRAIIIQLPLFGISLLAVPILTKNFMAFIDGVSYYLADTSQRDITRVALAIGVNVGDVVANNQGKTIGAVGTGGALVAGGTSVAIAAASSATAFTGAPLLASILQGSIIVLLLIGVAFLMQALGLWALMQFREASIVLVLAVIPLSMSASIWPTLTRTANKFIKLLASLIVAKIPIVMALSMGLSFLSEWAKGKVDETAGAAVSTATTMSNIPQGGNRVLIMGMAIFCLAFLAPTFVITLFDAIGEMGGSLARGLHTAAGQKGLQYASQAAGLKGAQGVLTGNHMAKAKAAKPGGTTPSKGEINSAIRSRKAQEAASMAGGGGSSGPAAGPSESTSSSETNTSSSSSNTTNPQGAREGSNEGGGMPGPQGPQGPRAFDGKDGKDGRDAGSSSEWSNKAPKKGEGLK